MVPCFACHRKKELQLSTVPLIGIKRIIIVEDRREVLAVTCASKPFEAIVLVESNLDVLDCGPGSDTTKSDTLRCYVRRVWEVGRARGS